MRGTTIKKVWTVFGSFFFAVVGGLSLLITDLTFKPLNLGAESSAADVAWFSRSPLFLLSCTVPPMVAAGFSAYRWLFKGSRFFGSWLNVALAAWLSLVINPMIWILFIFSHGLFGAVALGIFLLTGVVMNGFWRELGANPTA